MDMRSLRCTAIARTLSIWISTARSSFRRRGLLRTAFSKELSSMIALIANNGPRFCGRRRLLLRVSTTSIRADKMHGMKAAFGHSAALANRRHRQAAVLRAACALTPQRRLRTVLKEQHPKSARTYRVLTNPIGRAAFFTQGGLI